MILWGVGLVALAVCVFAVWQLVRLANAGDQRG
jgi:hypothetical protein